MKAINYPGSQLPAKDENSQNYHKHKYQVVKIWPPYFNITHCILFINSLKKGKTIKSKYYMKLLALLKYKITKKRPHMKKKQMPFRLTMHRVTSESQQ